MAVFPGSGPISSTPCAPASPERPARRRVWGRNKGPGLKPSQIEALNRLGPEVSFDPPAAPFDPASLFETPRAALALEIGFGGGEHLAGQARARPDWGFLGVEPFLNGVAKLLCAIDRDGLDQVRVMRDDARLLLSALAPSSLDRIWVLYPDPWPKARHKKRRIVDAETLPQLARALRPGGRLRLATDIDDYARQMLECALATPALRWTAGRADDWRRPPEDWIPTRYEAKALREGRRPTYFEFERRD